MDNTYNIAFCVNDNYMQYIAVTIKSILEHNKQHDITFHILTDEVSLKSKKRLESIINAYQNKKLIIHSIDDHAINELKIGKWTKYAWYRIFLPQVLKDVSKALYLDADTIVTDDLTPLFNLNMDEKSIAAAYDFDSFNDESYDRCGYPKEKGYICSGVLLMNLDFWRKHNFTDKILTWAKENEDKIFFPDQDSINFVCQDSKIFLPLKYGITTATLLRGYFFKTEYKEWLQECLDAPVIIHYNETPAWIEECPHPLREKWIYYNNLLEKKAHRFYKTKGYKGLKCRIWDLFHPNGHRHVSITEIQNRIDQIHNL